MSHHSAAAAQVRSSITSLLLTVNMAQASIESASPVFMKHYEAQSSACAQAWWEVLSREPPSPTSRHLLYFYVLNDVLQNSKRVGNRYLEAFAPYLVPALQAAVLCGPMIRDKVRRTVKIWADRSVYSPRYVGEILAAMDKPAGSSSSSLANTTNPPVQSSNTTVASILARRGGVSPPPDLRSSSFSSSSSSSAFSSSFSSSSDLDFPSNDNDDADELIPGGESDGMSRSTKSVVSALLPSSSSSRLSPTGSFSDPIQSLLPPSSSTTFDADDDLFSFSSSNSLKRPRPDDAGGAGSLGRSGSSSPGLETAASASSSVVGEQDGDLLTSLLVSYNSAMQQVKRLKSEISAYPSYLFSVSESSQLLQSVTGDGLSKLRSDCLAAYSLTSSLQRKLLEAGRLAARLDECAGEKVVEVERLAAEDGEELTLIDKVVEAMERLEQTHAVEKENRRRRREEELREKLEREQEEKRKREEARRKAEEEMQMKREAKENKVWDPLTKAYVNVKTDEDDQAWRR